MFVRPIFSALLALTFGCCFATRLTAQLYRDSTGVWVSFLQTAYERFDQVTLYSDQLAVVYARGKYGLATPSGQLVCPSQYEVLWPSYPASGFFAARRAGKYGYVNEQGREIIPFRYDYANAFKEQLAVVQLSGQWGYIDTAGAWLGSFPENTTATAFENGFALLQNEDGTRHGVMDRSGRLIIPVQYAACRRVTDDAWVVMDTLKRAWLIDDRGQIRNKAPFTNILPLTGGDFLAEKDGVWRRYNSNNEVTGEDSWAGAADGRFWKDYFIIVKNNNKTGVLDRYGKVALPCEFESIHDFSEVELGNARIVSRDGFSGYFYQGRMLLPCRYLEIFNRRKVFFGKLPGSIHFVTAADSTIRVLPFSAAHPLSDSRIAFRENEMFGMADTSGRVLVAPNFQGLEQNPNKHLFRFTRFGYTGWIDELGRERIPPVYKGDNLAFDQYGRSTVQRNGLYGLLDTSGHLVLDCRYDAIRRHYNVPLYIVQQGRLSGCMDYNGREVLPIEFDELNATGAAAWMLARKGQQWGVFYRGEAVLPLEFEAIVCFRFPLFLVRKAGKWGAINILTEAVVQPFDYEIPEILRGSSPVIVRQNGKYGALDEVLQLTVPVVFDSLISTREWFFALQNGRWGAVDGQGRWLQTPAWDSVRWHDYDCWYYWKNGLKGLIGTGGKILARPEYDHVMLNFQPVFAVVARRGRHWTILDQSAKPRWRFRASRVGIYRDGVLEIKNRGAWYLLDLNTLKRRKKTYDQLVYQPNVNLYWARKQNKWGVLDAGEKLLVPCDYDQLDVYRDILVYKDGKTGLYDLKGKMLLPAEYDKIDLYSYLNNNQYTIKKNNKNYTFLPETGEIRELPDAIWPDFSVMHSKRHRTAIIEPCTGKKYGLLLPDSTRLLPCEYDEIFLLEDSLYLVMRAQRRALYHTGNSWQTGFDFDDIRQSGRAGLFLAKKNSEWGAIDTKGTLVRPYGTTGHQALGPYLWEFCFQNACGARDLQGKEVVPPVYNSLYFREESGLLSVSANAGLRGLLRSDGTVLVPARYEKIENRKTGFQVMLAGKWGLLNADGSPVVPPEFDYISPDHGGYCIAVKGGRCGMLNRDGSVLIPFEYEFIDAFFAGLAAARRDGKWGFLHENGETAVPFIYDFACNFDPESRKALVLDSTGTNLLINTSGAVLRTSEWGCSRVDYSQNLGSGLKLNIPGMTVATFPHKWEQVVTCGLVTFDQKGKKGLMDMSGRVLLPARFDVLAPVGFCSETGLAMAGLNNKYGFINRKGKTVIPFRYDKTAFVWTDGWISVQQGKKWFKVDARGNCVEGCD